MDNVTSIKKKFNNPGPKQNSFGSGMYEFLMFMLDYYR